MVLSDFDKKRILFHYREGRRPAEIYAAVRAEGIVCHRQAVVWFLRQFLATGVIVSRHETPERPSRITDQVLHMVRLAVLADEETTATQVRALIAYHCGVRVSLSTILKNRQLLGWAFRGSRYYRRIRPINLEKRFRWAVNYLPEIEASGFNDVIWTGEAALSYQSDRRCPHQKRKEPAVWIRKSKPKQTRTVRVWAGITKRGATPIVLFEGTMTSSLYKEVLKCGLLKFIQTGFPNSHRLAHDNNPFHTSSDTAEFLQEEGICWWKIPPDSSDLNPIENLWYDLQEFVQHFVRPKTKSELIAGIKQFWNTITPEKCCKYIYHLRKVIPRVIEFRGHSTGY